jgi:hypothetical protein
MRVTSGHDAQQVAEMLRFAQDKSLELRQDGAQVALEGTDRVRSQMLHRIGLAELLVAAAPAREQ